MTGLLASALLPGAPAVPAATAMPAPAAPPGHSAPPRGTPQVLDLLSRYHATATFCEVDVQVAEHPDLTRRIYDVGMTLCDHTATHDARLATATQEHRDA